MNTTISIDEDARRVANLRVLQRIDPSIIEVVSSATHVVLYEFNESVQAWEKRNVEGSLFVAKRSDAPRFKLIVMNRNAKENLIIPLAAKFQMQVREPYLIFRLDKGEDEDKTEKTPIRGIWFHDGKEREVICNVLEKVMKVLAHATELEERNDPQQDVSVGDEAASSFSGLKIDKASELGNNLSEPPNSIGGKSHLIEKHDNLILDKKNLQLSLMSLLNEEKFVDLIHAQYLKVVNARAQRDGADN